MQLKVLSYNIHKGFQSLSRKLVLEEIRELLRKTKVDIVFLQEVIGTHEEHSRRIKKWPVMSQYEFLADQIWREHCYGQNSAYQGGHHGNAILSRFPLNDSRNIDISTNRIERRGLLYAGSSLGVRLPKIHLCCTHLNLTKRGRTKQIRHLCKWIGAHVPEDQPLIVAGDFNDWTKKASDPLYRNLGLVEVMESAHKRLRATFPAILPVLSLDRIYVRGMKVVEAHILKGKAWRKLSDHVPVLATLETQL